jgi:predicted ATPase/DNA-binding SARP family transcriptional activator
MQGEDVRRHLQRQAADEPQQQYRRPTGAGRSEPEAMRIKLLGGFQVWVGSRAIEENQWRLRKARSLVKLLALSPGHRLHREQAMELLWPGLEPHAAANNLHYALHVARRALEPAVPASSSEATSSSSYLHRGDEQLTLCPDSPVWVDVEAFEEAAAAARHARVEPAAFRAAIDLYAGELLPEDRYEPWVEERRAQLEELYLSLLLELAILHEEREEFGEAIEALGRVVAQEPTHDGAHVELMRLHALSGRRREALRQYERLREVLNSEFGTEPEEATTQLQQEIWAGTFPPGDSPPAGLPPGEEAPSPGGAARHNLPLARTSFIGRERERLEVKRLLAMTRLLTLTGAGGCGKTRLALEVARDLVGAYPDGVWLIELAPLSDPTLVVLAVASTLGVREQPGRPLLETLKDTLRPRKTLLVVDNCEHLVEAVARLVDALLDSCAGLRVLATSRETLSAAGEVNWVVPSLTVPVMVPDAPEVSIPQGLEAYESVRLFVERARQRDPSFVLSGSNGEAVAQVRRRLEGIPLAIELAAARMGVLSAEQLSRRLEDSLKLLSRGERTAEPRHRSLRATIEWSHELLSEPERVLFRRLSVFAGGWTLEAAEEVCSGEGIEEGEVLDLLSELVERSLVVAKAGQEEVVRFRMLGPIRQYGQERLQESGQSEAIRSRHAASFLALAKQAGPELSGSQQVMWLERLDTERDNLRAAMRWLLGKGESETAARFGWAVWLFWWMHGYFTEGRRWMEEALAKSDAMPASARAKALFVAGTMADGQGDRRSAEPLLEESLGLFKELGDKLGSALALGAIGLVAVGQRQHERGIAFFQEAVDLFLELGQEWTASVMLSFLAVAWFRQGDLIRAKRLADQGLELAQGIGDPAEATSIACCAGATLAQAEGDHERAKGLFGEGLKLSAVSGEESNVAYCLQGLAVSAASEGRQVRAARLWGAAEALLEKIEATAYIYAPDRSVYQDQVSAARAQLDEAAWEAAWAKGRAMALEQAVEYGASQ